MADALVSCRACLALAVAVGALCFAPRTLAQTAQPTTAVTKPQRVQPRWDRARRWLTVWRTGRGPHRSLRLARLRQRLGDALKGAPIPATVLDRLRSHAQRIARLERIREVAIDEQNAAVLDRVDRSLRRERGHHSRWLRDVTPAPASAKDGGP